MYTEALPREQTAERQDAQLQPYENEEPLLDLSEVLESNQIEEDTVVKLAESARKQIDRAFSRANAYSELRRQ